MRSAIKKIVFAISYLLAGPLIAAAWIEKCLTKGEAVFVGSGQFLSLLPGMPGTYLRAAYYYGTLERCSWEVHLGFGTFFTHRAASLGRHVAVGAYCVIGTVAIGDEVMVASRVSFTSGKRQHLDEEGRVTSIPIFEKISIGNGTWIGEGAILMANVGSNCIVSAGAVVAKEVPAGCLVAGNQLSKIKIRSSGKKSKEPTAIL